MSNRDQSFKENYESGPNARQSVHNPNLQPVSILISNSESAQVKRLTERCNQLESYCRELIHTNRVLDVENRFCMQQILSLNKEGGR